MAPEYVVDVTNTILWPDDASDGIGVPVEPLEEEEEDEDVEEEDAEEPQPSPPEP